MERKVIKGLPSSFVASNMKLATDRGSGEAKLWVGQMSNANELDAFFAFDEGYSYSFSQENMLEYLDQVKFEYVFQKFNNYKNASLITWNDNRNQIKGMSQSDFIIHLTKFTDNTRYYVRADEDIFKKVFRNIAVPKLTNVVFVKDDNNKTITLALELNLEYDASAEKVVTSWYDDEIQASEYSAFKQLLRNFVKQLNINNGIEDGTQKYMNGGSTASKEWLEQWNHFNGFELSCRFARGYQKTQDGASYLNYVWVNINPHYDIDTKAVLSLRVMTKPDRIVAFTGAEHTVVNLDLDNDEPANEELRFFYREFRDEINKWQTGVYDTQADENDNVEDETLAVDPQMQKEKFRIWLSNQRKANGEPYSTNTIATYISQMSRGYASFDKYRDYESVFKIQKPQELAEYTDYLFNAPGFDEFNDAAGNKACSNGFVKYGQFLVEQDEVQLNLRYNTPLVCLKPRNQIIFGAPGTGKSYRLNSERKVLLGSDNETDYERVTFYPDYTYANFVGTYKPVPCIDSDGKEAITYKYVPGPFMRVYVNALKNGRTDDVKPFLLIIEEINRANVAAVFGDVFQLLDRDDSNISEYPIQASEDMKKYLAEELGGEPDDYVKIKLPNNMFIWATMNSADQGVFPMDTAFKRRWDFTYIGIDDNDTDIRGKTVALGTASRHKVEWNKLRKAINHFLARQKINEDKQLGPYFISRNIVVPQAGNEIDSKAFIDTFKNKVLMYLFEDAAKQKRSTLFEGCFDGKGRYSEICQEFEKKGIGIFNHEIVLETEPEDLATDGNTAETGDEQV